MGLWALTVTVPRLWFLNAEWETVSEDKHGKGGRLQCFLWLPLASIQGKVITGSLGNTPLSLRPSQSFGYLRSRKRRELGAARAFLLEVWRQGGSHPRL